MRCAVVVAATPETILPKHRGPGRIAQPAESDRRRLLLGHCCLPPCVAYIAAAGPPLVLAGAPCFSRCPVKL